MSTPIFPQVDPATGALPSLTEARYLSAAAGALKAPLSGAALVNPTATTPPAGDNTTKVATTAFVHGELAVVDPTIDATPTVKGKIQLAGDLGGTAAAPTVPGAVKTTGDQMITGLKTFGTAPVVPAPATDGDAANKAYVDGVALAGTPDASTDAKGKVQLAGDLGGTAAAPTVPTAVKLTGDQTIAGIKTFGAPPVIPDSSFGMNVITGLTAALAAKGSLSSGLQPVAELPAGAVLRVKKSGSTWPARPTTRTDVCVDWEGVDPSPSIVTSGTTGMYAGDRRSIPAS